MDQLEREALDYIRELLRDNADGHGPDHALRVYRSAMRIADGEPGCDRQITALAALLHDADDDKLFDTENNANARAFLEAHRVPAETAELVIRAVNEVSFHKNRDRKPSTPEGKIVQDADRLDAIGAVGIARTFAFGGARGRSLASSVQHFDDKLLLLKDLMNTETARGIAEKRHAYMEGFLREWRLETEDAEES